MIAGNNVFHKETEINKPTKTTTTTTQQCASSKDQSENKNE
jgi:hypothetical protein